MLITYDLLVSKRACRRGLREFDELYPNGVKVSTKEDLASIIRAGLGRYLGWFLFEFRSHVSLNPSLLVTNEKGQVGFDLSYTDLSNSDLSGADFEFADLRGVNFTNSCLNEACLYAANAEDAKFTKAKLYGCNLSWAILTGVVFAKGQLDDAIHTINVREV